MSTALCRWDQVEGRHRLPDRCVVTQARKLKWQEKREQYQAKASESFIEKHAAHMADRQAEIQDKALDGFDEAITKFREDMRATEKKRIDGVWVEAPVMRVAPKDLALLIDKFEVLFDRPAHIREERDLSVTSEVSVNTLCQCIELTRDAAAPTTKVVSPLPFKLAPSSCERPRVGMFWWRLRGSPLQVRVPVCLPVRGLVSRSATLTSSMRDCGQTATISRVTSSEATRRMRALLIQ